MARLLAELCRCVMLVGVCGDASFMNAPVLPGGRRFYGFELMVGISMYPQFLKMYPQMYPHNAPDCGKL